MSVATTTSSAAAAAIAKALRCRRRGCGEPGTVIVDDGVLLCSKDALEWYERERAETTPR